MKRYTFRGAGKLANGYTIIEVLIFLSVSGALLLSAFNLISGRQERVRFSQSVVALEQEFLDVFNDVSTGYYPSTGDFNCTLDGAGRPNPVASGIDREQGTNAGCIFAGKLLHFRADNQDDRYKIYTMVGPRNAQDLFNPNGQFTLLGHQGNPHEWLVENRVTQADVKLEFSPQRFGQYEHKWGIVDPGKNQTYHTLLVVPDFGAQSTQNNAVSGNASRVRLYGYRSNYGSRYLDLRKNQTVWEITNEVYVCLRQDGTGSSGREAVLKITPQLTIERIIGSQPSECTS